MGLKEHTVGKFSGEKTYGAVYENVRTNYE
jgi:hypothetical protein